MSSTLSKIHVTNSTGLSLNERFTAISSQPKVVTNIGTGRRSRSRSRSVQRQIPVAATAAAERVTSRANQRLLAQLQRKHKMQAALKLKRRSMRTVGGGSNGNAANGRIRRGSVKAFRVGANGKPIRTNSLARVATMKADKETLNNRNRPLRRSNSSGSLASRLGPRRPTVGGAAQRVAKRNLERQRRGAINGRGRSSGINNRGRSRSRSRTRTLSDNVRNRSRTRRNSENQLNNRSRSRNRNGNDMANTASANNVRRGRSRSRSRGRGAVGNVNKSNLPIKARLGVRPGAATNRGQNNRRRNASLTRRGVQTGRVQKRRNSTNLNVAGSDNSGRGRKRSRSAVRQNAKNGNVRSRSRSRTRKGQVGQQRQQQGTGQVKQQRNNRAPRGRSQQRRGNNNNNGQRGTNNNGKAQTQQRRGRSRSRTGRGGNNGGSRNQGNKTNAASKPAVNKEDLDKELDQYMATTKTENELDYLLKN